MRAAKCGWPRAKWRRRSRISASWISRGSGTWRFCRRTPHGSVRKSGCNRFTHRSSTLEIGCISARAGRNWRVRHSGPLKRTAHPACTSCFPRPVIGAGDCRPGTGKSSRSSMWLKWRCCARIPALCGAAWRHCAQKFWKKKPKPAPILRLAAITCSRGPRARCRRTQCSSVST